MKSGLSLYAIATLAVSVPPHAHAQGGMVMGSPDTGQMRITGAMYTMPRRASPAALDKRIPLSVTQWHLHTKLCAPRKGQEQRYYEVQDGKPLFGLAGTITTKEACDAENGKFHPAIFGWMVHANVFEGTDLRTVWGHVDQQERAEHRP